MLWHTLVILCEILHLEVQPRCWIFFVSQIPVFLAVPTRTKKCQKVPKSTKIAEFLGQNLGQFQNQFRENGWEKLVGTVYRSVGFVWRGLSWHPRPIRGQSKISTCYLEDHLKSSHFVAAKYGQKKQSEILQIVVEMCKLLFIILEVSMRLAMKAVVHWASPVSGLVDQGDSSSG